MPATVPKVPLFDGHRKRKQRRQEEERAQIAILERAALEAEEYAKDETYEFLESWLESSMWSDQMEQISITREALPSIDRLWAYGDLAETEGTHACRKLFKAVVIWDDLGHGLWQTLKNDSRRWSRSNSQQDEELYLSAYSTPRSRGTSPSSLGSASSGLDLSRRSSITEVTTSLRKGISNKIPMRRSTDPQVYSAPTSQDPAFKAAYGSRSRLHKIIPHGCYSNMSKKSVGSVHESDCN
ncbi:hypothetical protein BGZ63DRAFT_426674 [Mariannaea sp. PMI_226]|nr:hypothetical protein BGZ63DRAFT_426674 [Mariannaea sp. PMI_226]